MMIDFINTHIHKARKISVKMVTVIISIKTLWLLNIFQLNFYCMFYDKRVS